MRLLICRHPPRQKYVGEETDEKTLNEPWDGNGVYALTLACLTYHYPNDAGLQLCHTRGTGSFGNCPFHLGSS
jgi:hypothetical protein